MMLSGSALMYGLKPEARTYSAKYLEIQTCFSLAVKRVVSAMAVILYREANAPSKACPGPTATSEAFLLAGARERDEAGMTGAACCWGTGGGWPSAMGAGRT